MKLKVNLKAKCLIFKKAQILISFISEVKLLTIVPIVKLILPCEATVLLIHLLEAVKGWCHMIVLNVLLKFVSYSSERHLEHYRRCGLGEFE